MRYVIGIGSNMGDSVSIVRRAIYEIEAMFDVDVDERSALYLWLINNSAPTSQAAMEDGRVGG